MSKLKEKVSEIKKFLDGVKLVDLAETGFQERLLRYFIWLDLYIPEIKEEKRKVENKIKNQKSELLVKLKAETPKATLAELNAKIDTIVDQKEIQEYETMIEKMEALKKVTSKLIDITFKK